MSDLKITIQGYNLLQVVEKDVPALAGSWNGSYTREVPCPKCGGKDRFRVRLGKNGKQMAFCNHCQPKGMDAVGYIQWRDGVDFKTALTMWQTGLLGQTNYTPPPPEPPKPITQYLADAYHEQLTDRAYFHGRGINDYWIDKAKLGWAELWLEHDRLRGKALRRWSIPAFTDTGELATIQYRITAEREQKMKQVRQPVLRYISQPGGIKPFPFIPWPDAPYILVDESPLDALLFCSMGFPAMAPMYLNSESKAWDPKWNNKLKGKSVVIVAQNDGGTSERIALLRAQDIPLCTVKVVPRLKDAGKLFESGWRQADFAKWLSLPPLRI